ncbi:hypothetical protein EVJ58_g9505 [Rhodofomes roseus]|nr:hypothetical protein EVJ58_g9505 [Rhodofomes roseus]
MSSDSGEVANHAGKRPRLDSVFPTIQGPLTDVKHDEQLWYPDGNIILVAKGVGFRVYRGLLADRSEVFRDLFSVPQPPDDETVDGCPIVHLSDTDIALREFLLVLLRGKRYSQEDDPELDLLSFRIRLAHKYGVTSLLEASVSKLKALYPSRLAVWQSMRHTFSPRAITAVNLAHLTGTLTVLPAALYCCCQLPDATLLRGATHPDGSNDCLNQDDLLKCIGGKVYFAQEQMQTICFLFLRGEASCSHRCPSKPSCKGIFNKIHSKALARAWERDTIAWAMEPWDDILNKFDPRRHRPDSPNMLCVACMKRIDEMIEEHFTSMWDGLPYHLGVTLDDTDKWSQSGTEE